MTRPQLVVSSSGASSLLPSYTPTDTSPGAAGGFIIEISIKPLRPILPRCGLQTHRVSYTISSELIFGELSVLVEIGVALTTFGGLFMILGVMLFFDGALLALGNVRFSVFCAQHLISIHNCVLISLTRGLLCRNSYFSSPALRLSLVLKRPSTSSHESKNSEGQFVSLVESCWCSSSGHLLA